jgi:hypothetical protein
LGKYLYQPFVEIKGFVVIPFGIPIMGVNEPCVKKGFISMSSIIAARQDLLVLFQRPREIPLVKELSCPYEIFLGLPFDLHLP